MKKQFLSTLCHEIYKAESRAEYERKLALIGGEFRELVVIKRDKVIVEIRKEKNHKTPHMHISHSDRFDVSISLNNFSILAGDIDRTSKKELFKVLKPRQSDLIKIWNELNEKENSIAAEEIISNLGF